MSRRHKPRKGEPQGIDEVRDEVAASADDAREWRRLAETTDIEWIHAACLAQARECDAREIHWRRRLANLGWPAAK